MAIFYLKTIPVSRSKGQSATAGSAYRAGEKITDQRTGKVHDYTKKSGVIETMMFNNFNLTREELWNMSEASNSRINSRIAREFQVALPHELSNENHKKILNAYAKMLARRYGVAVDVAIHEPGKRGDHRNVHAHIYCTTQTISNGRLGAKSLLERSDSDLKKSGHMIGKKQIKFCRAYWQRCVNAEFRKMGMFERIKHRSNQDRNLSRIPQVHVGPRGTALARRKKGHLSDEWLINQAINAYNNVISIDEKRNEKTNAQEFNEAAEEFGGLAVSQGAAEIEAKKAKESVEKLRKMECKQLQDERWKPVIIDPQKGPVISIFQRDNQGIYRWTKGRGNGREAFRATSKVIRSRTINSWALAAELELAKTKVAAGEWSEIRTFGSTRYRRAAWIQAQTMGIKVVGYEPTKEELTRYQQPIEGLTGDQQSVPQTRFSQDPNFQRSFGKNTSTNDKNMPDTSSIPRSPKM